MAEKDRESAIGKGSVAVLGANGRVSEQVAIAFAEAGWHVIAISRKGSSPSLEGMAGIETRAADAMDREALVKACAGADVIFNGLNPVYTDWREYALPMARNVLAAAEATGALHLFPGNVYNYGSSIPEVVTVATPKRPDHRKAQIREDMESLFRRAAAEGQVRTAILRPGDYFGGTRPGSWFDLVAAKDIAKGRFTLPGNGRTVHSWAYLPDLAQAFVALAQARGKLDAFEELLFEGHAVTGNAMHAAAEKAMGRTLKRGMMPLFLFPVLGLFSPMMKEIGEVAYLWKRPHRLDGGALEAVTGPLPHTPLDQAVAESLAALGHPAKRETSATLMAIAA